VWAGGGAARCTLKLMSCSQRRELYGRIAAVRANQSPMQMVAGPALTPTQCNELAETLGLEVAKILDANYLEVAKQRRQVTFPPTSVRAHQICIQVSSRTHVP
jgi:hypothetical protein